MYAARLRLADPRDAVFLGKSAGCGVFVFQNQSFSVKRIVHGVSCPHFQPGQAGSAQNGRRSVERSVLHPELPGQTPRGSELPLRRLWIGLQRHIFRNRTFPWGSGDSASPFCTVPERGRFELQSLIISGGFKAAAFALGHSPFLNPVTRSCFVLPCYGNKLQTVPFFFSFPLKCNLVYFLYFIFFRRPTHGEDARHPEESSCRPGLRKRRLAVEVTALFLHFSISPRMTDHPGEKAPPDLKPPCVRMQGGGR